MSDNAKYLLNLRNWLDYAMDCPGNFGRSYDHLMYLQACRLRETAHHIIGFMAA